MVIEKEIIIKKNKQDTWKVLGHEFAHPYRWASSVNHSEGHGVAVESTTCDERSCQTTMGNIREKLTHFSDAETHLSYLITEGMPSFVAKAGNDWKLTAVNANTTKLSIKMTVEMKGFLGALMQPLIRFQMNKVAQVLAEDFAYYVENGKPHPRKIKAQKKMRTLKTYLTINSAFSAFSGIVMLLFSKQLNDLFGIDHEFVFPFIGGNLIIFAVFVYWVSAKQLSNRLLVKIITVLDILWVVGSAIIVSFGLFELSKMGYILISLVAVWIAFLAYKQQENNK
jgi:Polyketide cyclase / dehydrase and lipid transport